MLRILSAGFLSFLAFAGTVAAQEAFPTRPINLVSPYPPGGAADLTARPLAPALEKVLKQPVIVVNRTGAGGAVGTQFVSQAPADGYTLMITVFSVCTIPEADRVAGRKPRFTRNFMEGAGNPLQALKNYVHAVKDRSYPAPEHCF